ncbi:MAG: hypothetical protein IKK98_07205 [Oscillospiraceae bacterium]|nr:hypothetical protein [Oscillospiraceae bacterium]MBQ7082651.1 hypothetical protein [Oscillospiraceae bacterium]MBR6608431.1 hypothetical protein [Oscillospiraceae bacterium]
MKHFPTVGEKYCPARRQNVPMQIWWDDEGVRQEQCVFHGGCPQQSAFGDILPPGCGSGPKLR